MYIAKGIRFKYIYPNYETFQNELSGTIASNILNEEFYNILYGYWANRRFAWSQDTQINSRVSIKYYDTWYKFVKMKPITETTEVKGLSTIEQEAKGYTVNNVEDDDGVESELEGLQTVSRNRLPQTSPLVLHEQVKDMTGLLSYIIEEWADLFNPDMDSSAIQGV